jgi:ATP-dependent RNA helicase DOB1
MSGKRKADESADVLSFDAEVHSQNENQTKPRRLAEDRVAAVPVGANLIECDGKSCTHEVAWPPQLQGSAQPPPSCNRAPARNYAFKLDPFQQTAINALEAGLDLTYKETECCISNRPVWVAHINYLHIYCYFL